MVTTMMEEVTQRQNACFEHPFITMINTLKNNDYVKNRQGSGWSKGNATFSTALDAYMDYLEKEKEPRDMQDIRDYNDTAEGLRW